jgi:hypothetical protein
MFNLETEIADWRAHMIQEGIERPEILDELESHLRSEIERHLAAGWDAERAFKTAVQQIGDARTIKHEFERAEDCQPPEMQKLLWVACIGFAALVSVVSTGVFLTSEMGPTKTALGLVAVSWTVCYLGSLPYVCGFLARIRNQVLREAARIILVLACPVWTLLLIMPVQSLAVLNFMYALAAIIPATILAISWSKLGPGRMTPLTPDGKNPRVRAFICAADDSFSESTCRSLELARGEASQLYHDYVGTEHVLLGLLEHDNVCQALTRIGLDRALVRREILRLALPGSAHQVSGNLPYTPRATTAMRLAMREAKASNASQVAPEHVLLGLIREGSGVASVALNNLGLNLNNARKLVRKFQ